MKLLTPLKAWAHQSNAILRRNRGELFGEMCLHLISAMDESVPPTNRIISRRASQRFSEEYHKVAALTIPHEIGAGLRYWPQRSLNVVQIAVGALRRKIFVDWRSADN